MTELRNQQIVGIGSTVNNGIDKATQSLNTIDYAHHEIHNGKHFYIEGHQTIGSSDQPGFQVGLTTPSGSTWAHFTWELNTNGIMDTKLYEDAQVSGGVAITPLNNNRNSTNTSMMAISGGASGTGGLQISDVYIGGEGFKSNVGGTSKREDELILKSGTTYRRDFYSASADNTVSFKASWYEHTDKVQQF